MDLFYSFYFYCYGARRNLHSFPTRRSSDLQRPAGPRPDHPGHARRLVPPRRAAAAAGAHHHPRVGRSEEHTSELQSHVNLVCRLLLEKKKLTIPSDVSFDTAPADIKHNLRH